MPNSHYISAASSPTAGVAAFCSSKPWVPTRARRSWRMTPAPSAMSRALAWALHEEFKPRGVCVTVLPPGLTDTPVPAKFGLDPKTLSMRAMKVDQIVAEGLNALAANRAIIIPGRMNRIMRAILPATATRSMTMKMLEKMPAIANPRPRLGRQ